MKQMNLTYLQLDTLSTVYQFIGWHQLSPVSVISCNNHTKFVRASDNFISEQVWTCTKQGKVSKHTKAVSEKQKKKRAEEELSSHACIMCYTRTLRSGATFTFTHPIRNEAYAADSREHDYSNHHTTLVSIANNAFSAPVWRILRFPFRAISGGMRLR
ncbi:hypothetical protein CBL_11438 [Carabus blaptoides fortunei]